MLKKRKGLLMIIALATACWLCGCNENASKITPTPTNTPMVSEPATPTEVPTDIPENTATPTPTNTPTPTPTPTNTPTPTPTPIPTVPPAPAAINTNPSTYEFLVNREHPLTETYKPADLVNPNVPTVSGSYALRKVAAKALEDLFRAAKKEKLTLYAVSGYRSYETQYNIYGTHLARGREINDTNLYSAAPGRSEHQTGLAMDVSCKSISYRLIEAFAKTPEGIWLKENCWRFGFTLRYQKGKEHITGYAYEPWHIRYVGVPLAYYLYTNNLTLEEYYGTSSQLVSVPLIDMTTDRFYNLYAKVKESELIYKEDGSVLVSETTLLPLLKEYIRDANGNIIRASGSAFFIEPIYDAEGKYVLDAEGNILYTKPYFDREESLWLDYSGKPVFLQPLWNADGTLATDLAGNILYTEPQKDLSGMEIITETGSLIQKVPMRDDFGQLIYNENTSVVFYEPLIDPITGQYMSDVTTGLPLYPAEYYEVPNNTLPLPPEFLPTDEPVIDEPIIDEPVIDEPVVDEPVVDEPIIDEPVVDEPIIDEPVVDEPIIDEPVVDEPIIDEPVVDEPTVDEPTVDEPTVDEPIIDEPAVDEPVIDEPIIDEPVVDTTTDETGGFFE